MGVLFFISISWLFLLAFSYWNLSVLANYDLESRVVMEPSVNAFSSDSWIQEKSVGPFDTVHATVMLFVAVDIVRSRLILYMRF